MMKASRSKSNDMLYYVLPMIGTAVVGLIGIAVVVLKTAH